MPTQQLRDRETLTKAELDRYARNLAAGLVKALPGWSASFEGNEDSGRQLLRLHKEGDRHAEVSIEYGYARPSGQALPEASEATRLERLAVYGSYRRLPNWSGYGYGTKHHEIGCSAAKTGEQVGREIARRLLPGYLADLDKLLEAHGRTVAQAVTALENAQRLVEVAGGLFCLGHDPQDRPQTEVPLRGGSGIRVGYLRVRVSDRTALLDGSVSIEAAEALLRALAKEEGR